jgi:hypothetical protein
MYSRLEDVPVYESFSTTVKAIHFNHVQRALNKLGDSIRLSIPRMRHLDLILEKQAWIIVDRVLNDVPIAAWTDFKTSSRDNVHQPISCTQKLFHVHAHLILDRSLEAMELMLGELLPEGDIENPAAIVPIDKKI